jgi:hypothetical protein
VLEGLAAYERAEREERQGGRGEGETETETETEGEGPLISLDEVRAARTRAEAFLLQRHLYKRLSTGEPADRAYLELSDEPRWRYDILRGLEYFRSASILDDTAPDPRLADAIAHLRSLSEDGKWRVQRRFRGAAHYHVGEVGDFSPIITLRATIVLRWWNEAHK